MYIPTEGLSWGIGQPEARDVAGIGGILDRDTRGVVVIETGVSSVLCVFFVRSGNSGIFG